MKTLKINLYKVPASVWLIVVLTITYFPLVVGRAVMKWDILDINYPWNYFITECLKNGVLPLWDPYSQYGFPLYGDPGTWYPFNWLILLFRSYDVIANHIIFLFHSFIAGYGMYKLSKYLISSKKIAVIAGICFMLSGFFVGNAQHIRWLVTAAWLPFSVYYFLKLYKTPDLLSSVKFGVIMFLMLSGGYPAIMFSYIYVLVILYGVFSYFLLKKYSKHAWFKWNLYIFISIIIFCLASLIVIVGAFDFSPYINRGKPLEYSEESKGVLMGSLPLKALYSFLFPFATGHQDIKFWGQDFSVLNCYCSFITIILIVFSLYKRLIDYKSFILIVSGIFALMLAMPQIFPFRYWLYKTLPLMGYFRFSSFFRLYAIFSFILAFAFILKKFENNIFLVNQLKNFLKIVFILILIFLLILFFKIDKSILVLIKNDFSYFREIAGIKVRTFVQGLIVLSMLLFLILALKRFPDKILIIFLFIVSFDMFQSTYLNLYDTIAYKSRTSVINDYCNNFPAGFPIPSDFTLKEFEEKHLHKNTFFFYRNTGELFKHVSPDAFSPYCLLSLEKINDTKIFNKINLQKVAFVIDRGHINKDIDSIIVYQNAKVFFKKFTPLSIEIEVDSVKKGQILVLSQSIYPYWKAYVNNIPTKIIPVYDAFIGVLLNNGKNDVKILFEAGKIKAVFWISFISWLIIAIYLCIKFLNNFNKPLKLIFLIFLCVLIILIIKRISVFKIENKGIQVENIDKYINDSTYVLINSGNIIKGYENLRNESSIKFVSIYLKKQIGELQKILKEIDKKYLCYVHNNLTFYPEVESILSYYYPGVIEKINYGRNFILILSREKNIQEEKGNMIFFTDFENLLGKTIIDSSESFSGKYCNYINGENIYSYTYEDNIRNAKLENTRYLKVSFKFKRKTDNSDPLIILDISRNGRMVYYQWVPIRWFETSVNEWNYASAIFPMNEILKIKDIVKVYFAAHHDDDKVLIDDFEVCKIE